MPTLTKPCNCRPLPQDLHSCGCEPVKECACNPVEACAPCACNAKETADRLHQHGLALANIGTRLMHDDDALAQHGAKLKRIEERLKKLEAHQRSISVLQKKDGCWWVVEMRP